MKNSGLMRKTGVFWSALMLVVSICLVLGMTGCSDDPSGNSDDVNGPIIPPHIQIDKSSISFDCVRGQSAPAGQSLTITNSGGGTLSWTLESNSDWLDVSPSSGGNYSTINVSLNSTCLASGVNNASITISGNADNPQVTIPVSVTITDPPFLMGRWPRVEDGAPDSRNSPITKISHQKNDERNGWQWTQVETTGQYHWQHDVKVEDDNLSIKIHGNKDNHRIQVGEPAIYRTSAGCYRLEFYTKHDRSGDNPILGFKVNIEHGRVTTFESWNVRGAGALSNLTVDLIRKGINLGIDALLNWWSGGILTLAGNGWAILDWLFPEDWLHQYKGWQLDAYWFAAQIGYLYARELPDC